MSSKPTRVLLITPQYLVENSVINSNTEQKILSKCIRVASDMNLMPLIGSSLYQTLVSGVTNGTMSAGPNKTFVDDYLAPCLTEYALLQYIPYTHLKFRNKGIEKQFSETSTTADSTDIGYMTAEVRDSAQFYGERMIKFLLANIQYYPDYYRYTTIDNISPARSDKFSGIQFPNSNRSNFGTFGLGLTYDINL